MTRAAAAPAPKRDARPPEAAAPAQKSPGEPGSAGLALAGGALLQRKLRLGAVDDPLEREADRVAAAVVSAPSPPPARVAAGLRAGRSSQDVQRCACDDDETLQRQTAGAGLRPAPAAYFQPRGSAPPGVTGAGRPLEPAVREFMEPRFGADLGEVRVHTGGEAQRSARELNARAYTLGHHVVFGASEYRPESPGGRLLLAHELTHVLQQAAGRTGSVQRSAADTAGANYDIDDTIFVLRESLRVALRSLGETSIPAARRAKIQTQFNRLHPLLAKLEGARSTDGQGVTFGFDAAPENNEVVAGDAQKSLAELYSGYMAPPTPKPPAGGGEASLQAWALPGGLRITPAFGSEAQRCELICVGVVILAGLLLAGCRSEQTAANRRTPCTAAEATEIETLHNAGLAWVNTAVTRLAAYRDGTAAADVRGWVEQALMANFHTTNATTVGTIATRLTAIQTRMAAGATGPYHCEFSGPADAYTLGEGSSAQIHLGPKWFSSTDRLRRITTLIHENGHATGLGGSLPLSSGRIEDIYEFHAGYATATPQQAIANPDPYSVFARQVANDGREGPGTHR